MCCFLVLARRRYTVGKVPRRIQFFCEKKARVAKLFFPRHFFKGNDGVLYHCGLGTSSREGGRAKKTQLEFSPILLLPRLVFPNFITRLLPHSRALLQCVFKGPHLYRKVVSFARRIKEKRGKIPYFE